MEEAFTPKETSAPKILGFTLPHVEMPKIDFTKFDRATLDEVAGTVKEVATASLATATQTATKVRERAAHTITLVREAVGV